MVSGNPLSPHESYIGRSNRVWILRKDESCFGARDDAKPILSYVPREALRKRSNYNAVLEPSGSHSAQFSSHELSSLAVIG